MQSMAKTKTSNVEDLSPKAVLAHTPHCTIREQEEQYLFYNTITDEMHLIPPTGTYVYELCDGIASIEIIEKIIVAVLKNERSNIHKKLKAFLKNLVERGILEIV